MLMVVCAVVVAGKLTKSMSRRLSRSSMSGGGDEALLSTSDRRVKEFEKRAKDPDYVYVSCPYMENKKKLDYQDKLNGRCAQRANEHNAIVDGEAATMAGTDENPNAWEQVWKGIVWKVIQSVFMKGEITLVLINGGGEGCKKERETVPKLIEFIQKKLYASGKITQLIFGQLPKVSYKIVDMDELMEKGPKEARCLMEGEGDGIIGGEKGGGQFMEFDEKAQAYVTSYMDLPEAGLTQEDVKHVCELLKKDEKFKNVE